MTNRNSENLSEKTFRHCSALYLHSDGALSVALVRQHEEEGAARLTPLRLRDQRHPPDEEAGGREDSPWGTILQLEEQRRALWV